MNSNIVLSRYVINTINSLPEEERLSIASALAGEMILGAKLTNELNPQEEMIYTVIRNFIMRDSHEYNKAMFVKPSSIYKQTGQDFESRPVCLYLYVRKIYFSSETEREMKALRSLPLRRPLARRARSMSCLTRGWPAA